MAFPWVTVIMWVLSFFLAKNKGMSKGKAALVATGAAAATWAVAEPTNKNNLAGWGAAADKGTASVDAADADSQNQDDNLGSLPADVASDEEAAAALAEDPNATTTKDGKIIKQTSERDKSIITKEDEAAASHVLSDAIKTTGGVAETVITTTGDVAKSFGPAGTVGVVAGTHAAKKTADTVADATEDAFGGGKGKYLIYAGLGVLALVLLK